MLCKEYNVCSSTIGPTLNYYILEITFYYTLRFYQNVSHNYLNIHFILTLKHFFFHFSNFYFIILYLNLARRDSSDGNMSSENF